MIFHRRRQYFPGCPTVPWRIVCVVMIALVAMLGTSASSAHAENGEVAINAGAFFPTTIDGNQDLGFSVTDDRNIRLWSAWQALGGQQTLGAPLSRRFIMDGLVSQVFERGVLRWHPHGSASIANAFDDLAARGHNPLLLNQFGVPQSANWAEDNGDDWPGIQTRHMALLTGSEPWRMALRTAYRTANGPLDSEAAAINLYGLPMAVEPTTAGYVLRAQRAAWVIDPDHSSVAVPIDLATVLTTTGSIPSFARVPHRADERPHLPPRTPTSAVHFFDWWRDANLPSEFFTHGLNWERIGIHPSQIGTPAYYDANFRLIRDLGVDGVFWEWYEGANLKPTTTVINSLRRHGLKIGLFYDWELLHAGGQAVLSDRAYIAANETSLSKIVDETIAFYLDIPRDLWLTDAEGRLPVAVYAYGFPQRMTDIASWTWFFTELPRRVEAALSADVIFDWSVAYLPPSQVQEFAFERWPETYAPFNFVVDLPQSQFGHHIVTWNYIFDNRGVAARDGLPRVIRDDNRYLQETDWLARHTQPSLIFIYSWNEFWEGSHLFPDDTYEWRRYNLAQAQLKALRSSVVDDLPRTVVITDSAVAFPDGTNGLLENQRTLVRHFLRRYVPQADLITANQVTMATLEKTDMIVSLTTDRRVDALFQQLPARIQIVYWNANDLTTEFARRFVQEVDAERPLGRFEVQDSKDQATGHSMFAEGDVWLVTPNPNAIANLYFDVNGTSYPLIIKSDNDQWINIYGPTEIALQTAFETVYGRALEPAITFALGGNIQRLEVYPDGRVIQNTFSAPSVFRHEPLAIPTFEPATPADLPNTR